MASVRFSRLAFAGLALASCARAAPRTAAPPPPTPPAAELPAARAPSWTEARLAARAALEAHDYARYRRQLELLYARSGSIWVLRDLARADASLGDRASAEARLDTIARAGLALSVADDPAFASLEDDPSFEATRARFTANEAPIAQARVLFPLPHEDLLTEDVAHDPRTGTFYVGSVRHRKVLAIDRAGRARDFVAEGTHGLMSVMGLAIVGDRLWATTSTMPPMIGFDPKAPSATALLAFELRDGSPVARIGPPADGREHLFCDLSTTSDGTLLVADDADPMIYALPPGGTALVPLAPRDELVSPQTAATSPDGHTVLVPDYVRGIAAIDLASRRLAWLGHADDVALAGIDGLYFEDAHTLVAVQNGVQPPRVARLVLGADGTSVVRLDVLERATPGFAEPTHGVFVDGSFVFLAAAGWTRFDEGGTSLPNAPPDAPALWSLPRGAR